MNFDIPSETKMILQTIREFVDKEIVPLERPFLAHDYATLNPLVEEKRQKAKSLGLWLPQIPADHGGMGLSLLDMGW